MWNRNFRYLKYTVQPGENISDIANRLHVNAYAILEINDVCSDYEDVDPGQVIVVPSNYAYKMVLQIDKNTMLPVTIKIFDDNGLFEEYVYNNFELNPDFAANEFEADFLEYSF